MIESGKTILVQRKYAISTTFLDTTLESEDVIREGETREDAMNRVMDDLDRIADNRRKKLYPHLYQEEGVGEAPPNAIPHDNGKGPVFMVINKEHERLEIAIDNCMCIDELDQLKANNPIFPAKLLDTFNKKRKELSK